VSNARQYPRYAIEAAVELTAADGSVVEGRSSNVSRGGLAAVIDAPLGAGDTVQLKMSLVFGEDSFSEPLELPVRVVWCTAMGDKHQLGTSFLPLSADQRQFLDMFLRYLAEGIAARDAEAEDEIDDEPAGPFDLS
jgi:hypothetical protein